MDKKFFNGLCVGVVSAFMATLGVVTIMQNVHVVDLPSMNKLNRITSLIEGKYYGDYTEEDIIEGIFTGSCFNLDEYSAYLSFEDYETAIDPDQEFGGIGLNALYNKYTRVYTVIYCYDDTPASRAGLKRNDLVEAIDGYDVASMDLDDIREMMRGAPGTTVSLKINRDGELLDFDLVREHINIPNAYSYTLSEDIGFIKITSFNGTVAEDFARALASVDGVKGIVIDLRGNPGGTVDCYKAVMEQLIPSGCLQTIVYKDGRREPLLSESSLTERKHEFVVLVDSGTASCSESMAQALADLANATIVGVETYGKGVAQEYFEVDDNSVLRLTVGYVESPRGVVWNEVGIIPDIEVKYEYYGDDFEESVLMNDSQVLAGYNALADKIGVEKRVMPSLPVDG